MFYIHQDEIHLDEYLSIDLSQYLVSSAILSPQGRDIDTQIYEFYLDDSLLVVVSYVGEELTDSNLKTMRELYGEELSDVEFYSMHDGNEFAIRDSYTRELAILMVDGEIYTGYTHTNAYGIVKDNYRDTLIDEVGENVLTGHFCKADTTYYIREGKTLKVYLPYHSDYIAIDTLSTVAPIDEQLQLLQDNYNGAEIVIGGLYTTGG